MENAIRPVKIYVVPGWIFRNTIRNKLNIVDISDYAKMRSILSLEDFAGWVHLNDIFKLNGKCFVSTMTLNTLFTNLTPEQDSEFKNSVVPLSASEDIASSMRSMLNTSNKFIGDESYKFISEGNNTYVILNEGFLSKLSETNFTLDFIKEYLKICYSLYSIPRVSLTGMYDLYVKMV